MVRALCSINLVHAAVHLHTGAPDWVTVVSWLNTVTAMGQVETSSTWSDSAIYVAGTSCPQLLGNSNKKGGISHPCPPLWSTWTTSVGQLLVLRFPCSGDDILIFCLCGNTSPSVNQVILMQACFWPVWKGSLLQIASLIGSTRVRDVCQFRFRCPADTRCDALLLYQVVLSSQPSNINGCFWYLSWS